MYQVSTLEVPDWGKVEEGALARGVEDRLSVTPMLIVCY